MTPTPALPDVGPFVFPPIVTTSRLLLRRFRRDDVADIHAIQSRADVVRHLAWAERTRSESQEWVDKRTTAYAMADDGDSVALAVATAEDTQVIGYLNLWVRSRRDRQLEIGCVFHPGWHGRGYAAEAIDALLGYAFEWGGAHRIYGKAYAGNEASIALMDRVGMRPEARLRQSAWVDGAWSDEVVHSVLEDDYRVRRAQAGLPARSWVAQ